MPDDNEDREQIKESMPEVPDARRIARQLPKRRLKESEPAADYRRMGIAYTIPTALIAPIVALTIVGVWADGKLHSSPVASLIGALLGIVCGFVNMIRLARKLDE